MLRCPAEDFVFLAGNVSTSCRNIAQILLINVEKYEEQIMKLDMKKQWNNRRRKAPIAVICGHWKHRKPETGKVTRLLSEANKTRNDIIRWMKLKNSKVRKALRIKKNDEKKNLRGLGISPVHFLCGSFFWAIKRKNQNSGCWPPEDKRGKRKSRERGS